MRAFFGVAGLALVAACVQAPPEVSSGRQLFETHCAGCHGSAGTGDGPDAAGLGVAVPDLTTIAARNGGTFPKIEVMSTIDGYRRAKAGAVTMPEFGAALVDAPMVLVDLGDGVLTPTPEPLVAVADYLESIQR